MREQKNWCSAMSKLSTTLIYLFIYLFIRPLHYPRDVQTGPQFPLTQVS